MKLVSQLDADGYLVGTTFADQSPLEPGVFLLPGGCVDAEPPQVPPGMRARWASAAWALEATPDPTDPEPPKTPDTFSADLAKLLLEFRTQRDVVLPRCLGIKDEFRDSSTDGTIVESLQRPATPAEYLQIKAAVAAVRHAQLNATSQPEVLNAIAAKDVNAVDISLRAQWAACVAALPLIAKIAFAKVDK